MRNNEDALKMWAAERLAEYNECRIKDINLDSIRIEEVFVESTECPEGDEPLCNCIYSHDEYSAVHITAKTAKPAGGYGYLDLAYILSVEDYDPEKIIAEACIMD